MDKEQENIIMIAMATESGRDIVSFILSELRTTYLGSDQIRINNAQSLSNFAALLSDIVNRLSPSDYLKLKNKEAKNDYIRIAGT